MPFSIQSWKGNLKKRFEGWSGRMKESGVKSIYAFVSASALLPVIQAVNGGDLAPIMELGKLVSGLGTSLLANRLQGWKDEADAAKKIESEIENNQDLRKELDELLQKLDAVTYAEKSLREDDRKWFEETLRKELDRMGNLQSFENVFIKADAVFIQPSDSLDPIALRNVYLNHLFQQCRQLSLAGVDPKAVIDEKEAQLKLDAVYTALITLTPEEHENLLKEKSPEREGRRQSVMEQLDLHNRLVILGDPGSGKSTFVNFAALCFSGEFLGDEKINLEMLRSPLPEEDEEKRKPQPWNHGALMPVRIILRDFAARGLPPVGEKATSDHIWQFVESELALKEYAAYLKKELIEKGGLVFFDGLDEVPEADKRRTQIRQSVEDFADTFHRCRIIVTSRTYAYQKQDWRLSEFSETVLAPFSRAQINNFIDHWYIHTANIRGTNRVDAQGKAEKLKRTISGNNRLYALAERPLLLTLMASLNAWRGGSLPEKREVLYADTVDLLLEWWVAPKTVRKSDGTIKVLQPSIAEFLKIDKDKVRNLLNELAFTVHKCQPEVMGTADISEKDLVSGLIDLSNNPEVKPARLIEFLVDRAGILLPRGIKVYTFPHRTFQEYLSACYLTDTDFPDQIAELVRKEPNRWREVALLACAKAARGTSSIIWTFVDAMCYCEPEDISKKTEDIWGAHIAAEALAESTNLTKLSEPNRKKLEKVRLYLREIISINAFPPGERTTAGVNLARIGDARKEVISLDEMPFCLVPKGDFQMGEKEGLHRNDTLSHDFWISQYPVTQSQFQKFIDDSGYKKEEYWKEAKDVKIWQDGKVKGRWDDTFREGPYQFSIPFSLPDHPVVGVTWYESLAFTRWLNEVWKNQGILPGDLIVKLPTEAEWEKAIRGGLEIPIKKFMKPVNDMNKIGVPTLEANTDPERIYPWGNEPDTNCANYSDTGIGSTSAAGCFSTGVTPYGCEEMSGNVWEWTRSIYKEYPYVPDDGRENLNESKDSYRVIRGGCFNNISGFVRCAYRGGDNPDDGDDVIGFRLVFSPF
ncbi:NTPase [Candidatus Scalindua japonica]|uniref:NTPase n=1 Tax=Candidatus Scalindua japonica TaxID=1284222 RepID=A0A286TZ15_9BACT|nr:SUMF1/EgtB/PvdO family nonheme iron enzyme [Candidatus Scalindua japonica]GAX61116.1 NTPase [Candidatus Scalindua japonica]